MYHPRFEGTHYDIGLKFGKFLKSRGIDFDKIIDLNNFQKDFGEKSLEILEDIYPEVCEEIRGLTEGLNFSYEKFAFWLACLGCCYEPRGCTGFCFIQGNNVYYGRNNDLPPFLKKGSASMLFELEGAPRFIGNTSSMVHFEEGINQSGLAAAMKFVPPTRLVPGINSLFTVRYLLEKCATTQEALETVQRLPLASACNFMLADESGEMTVAECVPGKVHIRRPAPDSSFIVAANHFVSGEMSKFNPAVLYQSDKRYQTAYQALRDIGTNDGIEYAKAILSGKHGFMCQYDRVLNFDTIWSTVFDITNRRIYRAEGNPSRSKFKEDIRGEKL